jgi:molybdate transport system substrate-binding protein
MKLTPLIFVILLAALSGCIEDTKAENLVLDFSDLYKNGTRIASCEPSHCPAGRYASMVVSNVESDDMKRGTILRQNIVTNDPNVRAVLDKVITREVDAGFVYLTDAYLEDDMVRIIEIPREFSPLPQYGASVINDTQDQIASDLFIEFLLSKEGQQILQEYGFAPAVEEPQDFERKTLPPDTALTIYAASSLTDAFDELTGVFEEHVGFKPAVGYGSSGLLRARIEGGAPADIYATASLSHTDILIEGGFTEEYAVFARNHLVVVTPR